MMHPRQALGEPSRETASQFSGHRFPQSSLFVAAVALGALALFVFLYSFDKSVYFRVLGGWAFNPFTYPFLDAECITAQVRCWQHGIDVYLTNPCDVLGRIQNYSPLLLRFRFLSLDRSWTNVVGLTEALCYISSLTILPAPSSSRARLFMILAVLSPPSMYAVERGNVDLLMFASATVVAALLERGLLARVSAYGLVLAAASLKFYPLILLARVLREKLNQAVIVGVLAAAAVTAFVLTYGTETLRALRNVPHPFPFGDGIGAAQFGEGLALLFNAPSVMRPLTILLLLLASSGAVMLAVTPSFIRSLSSLPARESNCLLVGTLLMAGCFFTGPSVGYRAIFVILALPGLLAMADQPNAGLLARCSGVIAVSVLWINLPLAIINGNTLVTGQPGSLLFNTLCLAREAIWWILMTVFLTVIVRFVIDSLKLQVGHMLARS